MFATILDSIQNKKSTPKRRELATNDILLSWETQINLKREFTELFHHIIEIRVSKRRRLSAQRLFEDIILDVC